MLTLGDHNLPPVDGIRVVSGHDILTEIAPLWRPDEPASSAKRDLSAQETLLYSSTALRLSWYP